MVNIDPDTPLQEDALTFVPGTVVGFTIASGRIVEIDLIANPDKIRF